MLNIIKIWFFTSFYLLKNRKEIDELNKLCYEEKLKKNYELLKNYTDYILEKIDMKVELVNETYLNCEDNVLYIANHPSMVDAFFLLKYIKDPSSFFIAASSKVMLKLPLIKHVFKNMNNVFIDRENIREGIKNLKEGTELLKNDFNLVIFPEGQITQVISNELVGDFKNGAFKTAIDAKVDIIPITIIPKKLIQKKPSIFSSVQSSEVKVVINKRIKYEDFKNLKTSELSELTRKSIINYYKEEEYEKNI